MQHAHSHHGPIAALRRGLAAIDLVFCKIAKIQFSAPWRGRGTC